MAAAGFSGTSTLRVSAHSRPRRAGPPTSLVAPCSGPQHGSRGLLVPLAESLFGPSTPPRPQRGPEASRAAPLSWAPPLSQSLYPECGTGPYRASPEHEHAVPHAASYGHSRRLRRPTPRVGGRSRSTRPWQRRGHVLCCPARTVARGRPHPLAPWATFRFASGSGHDTLLRRHFRRWAGVAARPVPVAAAVTSVVAPPVGWPGAYLALSASSNYSRVVRLRKTVIHFS